MPGSIHQRAPSSRKKLILLGISFLTVFVPCRGQQFLGAGLEGGAIRSILTNGSVEEPETKAAFGVGAWWLPGDLLIKPAFLTDGENHSLSLSAGARLFGRVGLSLRGTLLRDRFQNTFFDNTQELQRVDRSQWFLLFGGDISYFPALSSEMPQSSWAFTAGFSYLSGGTFVGNIGLGYTWKLKDKKSNE